MPPCLAAITVTLLALQATFAAPMPHIIPAPRKMEAGSGNFEISKRFRIFSDPTCRPVADQLAGQLRRVTGFPVPVESADVGTSSGHLTLTTHDAASDLGAEGYTLHVTPDHVIIRGKEASGVFYGVQTFMQLLPPEAYGPNLSRGVKWQLPSIKIEDRPEYRWRGMLLDVARHFSNKEEVKKVLDTLAVHKANTFHWHLTDDQGWRLQIKKYPNLTDVGAWRSGIGFGLDPRESTAYGKDGRYGGFYTQEDIKEVLAYARERHITIVPEIEMPGHATAALSAHPQLSCSGQPHSTDVPAGVHSGVYCAGKEETFAFLEDVLTEVIALFPSKYIHIGGDEVPKGNWKNCSRCQARMKAEGLKDEHELQSYFVRRIEKLINSKQRNLVGWSEIREGGLARNAVVMDWIGGALEAAGAGHDVIMTPTTHCYLDYYQSAVQALEPRAIGGYIPLEKVYSFNPTPAELDRNRHHHILGVQGNVWTEYIASLQHVEYMALPRLAALMEVAWSPKHTRDYDDFRQRLETQYRRYAAMGVNFRRDSKLKVGGWKPAQITTNATILEWDISNQLEDASKAGITLAYQEGAHGLRIDWVALIIDGKEVARDSHPGFTGASSRKPGYLLEIPPGTAGNPRLVRAQVAGDGGTDSWGEVHLEIK
jgi:hexosaminidase